MKVVYFIQSHKNPEQVDRLVDVIKQSSPNSLVLLSHDFSCSELNMTHLNQYSGIEIIKRYRSARRGDRSMLMIYLDVIQWLFEHHCDFDWLICLSGQDYPVQPIPAIEAFLDSTKYDGFIKHWEVLSEESPWGTEGGHKRFFAQYISLPLWTKWWLRKATRIEPFLPFLKIQWRFALIGRAANSVPFDDHFKCYGGWYWNTLSKECIDFVRNYLEENPNLLKFYQKTLAPEESLIATILLNSKQFNLANDSLRYLDFPSKSGCARSLTEDDYDEIISGDFHFARKFEPMPNNRILDLLDQVIRDKAQHESKAASVV